MSMPTMRRPISRRRAGCRFASLLMVAIAVLATTATAAFATGKVEIVTQSAFPTEGVPKNTHYFHKIQEAVDATTSDDWVLVEPGVYEEEVKVEKPHHKIWIRGMDRNGVILDGSNISTPGSNGIEVKETSNVWIENLTVRNFEEHGGGGGNEIWWNGGADSGRVKAHGWYGAYLTAYVTGEEGAYGIFTGNETIGAVEPRIRIWLQRLRAVPGRVSGMPGADQRRDDGKQLARLFGLQLRRAADLPELRLQAQLQRDVAGRRKPRRSAAAE